jgi:transcriptional regulator with XRE-family HTH domain
MKLKDYLFVHNLSYGEFAKITGILKSSLWNYVQKKQKPSLQNAQKIFKATHGTVTFDDLQN